MSSPTPAEAPACYYPVVLEFTETRITWVQANSEKEAQRYAGGDCDLWEGADPVNCGGVQVVDDGYLTQWALDDYQANAGPSGPPRACRHCGAVAKDAQPWALRFADHAPTCPGFIHRARLVPVYEKPGHPYDRIGYVAGCRCGTSGFLDAGFSLNRDEVPDGVTIYEKPEPVTEILREHVKGRPRRRNFPLGITDDLAWDMT